MPVKDDLRYDAMVELRFDKLWTLKNIGDKYGITKERVRQILGNTGAMCNVERNKKISNSTKSNGELAKIHNLSVNTVSQLRNGEVRHEVNGGNVQSGYRIENYVSKTMKNVNIPNTLMPNSHPFDMIAFDNIKIDVKGCLTPQYVKGCVNPRWGFSMDTQRRGKYCDFFICVIWDTKDCFIIPFDVVGIDAIRIYFCWPTNRPQIGKYQKYLNRWDLLWQKALDVDVTEIIDFNKDYKAEDS
jgi:hypothetical protein